MGLLVGVGGALVEVVGVRRWGGRWSIGGALVEVGGASGRVGECQWSVGGVSVDCQWKVSVVGPDNSTDQPTNNKDLVLFEPPPYMGVFMGEQVTFMTRKFMNS